MKGLGLRGFSPPEIFMPVDHVFSGGSELAFGVGTTKEWARFYAKRAESE
jgi:hypothetical protein